MFSSKVAPEENVAVLAYSENQEAYSPALIEAKYKCPVGEPCDPYDPPPYDPPTVEMAKGLNITKFRTVGWNDGAFNGALEVRIGIYQLGASGTISGIPYSFATYHFISLCYLFS